MGSYFRAVAVDYDGTMTEGARPSGAVLQALAHVRATAGLRIILVTGRILSELRSLFPDFDDHFDRVVAENGAVLHGEGVTRTLTAPVPVELDAALLRRGIPFRRGQALLACDGEHDLAVLEELRWAGSDCQIVRNRSQLMVLPAGITKGTGLAEALLQLGISRHNTVAIGDAENDQALLSVCELGVGVANAVPSLQERADVVLTESDGAGVARFISGPLLRDELRVEPRRWQVDLGRGRGGAAVALPGSGVNVLITGGSGSGKSYAAGLFAERLIGLGYSVCVFDPEGDHGPLGRLRNVVLVGGREPLPPPAQLAKVVERGLGSVVVDLTFASGDCASYVREALGALDDLRARNGVPHWIFIDEAHLPFEGEGLARRSFDASGTGYCLVTYRPGDLYERAKAGFDFLLVLPGAHGIDPEIRRDVAHRAGISPTALDPELTGVGPGQAVLVRLGPPAELRVFTFAPRWVAHVRHWHKYAGSALPPAQRFHFRSSQGQTGAIAANLAEFHHEIRRCSPDTLRHHAAGSDFSRWIQDVIQDSTLAANLRTLEARLRDALPEGAEELRSAILEVIETRYLT